MTGGMRPLVAGNLPAHPDIAETVFQGALERVRQLGDGDLGGVRGDKFGFGHGANMPEAAALRQSAKTSRHHAAALRGQCGKGKARGGDAPFGAQRSAQKQSSRRMDIGRFAQKSAVAAALAFMSCYAGSALAQSQDCERLRQAIAKSSTTGNVAQYQAAAQRQQDEIERMSAYARSIGCENHRFLFFGSEPPPSAARSISSSGACAPTSTIFAAIWAAAGAPISSRATTPNAPAQPGPGRSANVFELAVWRLEEQLPTSRPQPLTPDGTVAGPSTDAHAGSQAVCVRTCDGSFFPVSYAANGERYDSLENMCRALCPNAEVALYTFPFGSDIEQAVSPTGQRYMDSPNALKYRTTLDPNCTCRRKGQSWYEALAGAEARLGLKTKATSSSPRRNRKSFRVPSPRPRPIRRRKHRRARSRRALRPDPHIGDRRQRRRHGPQRADPDGQPRGLGHRQRRRRQLGDNRQGSGRDGRRSRPRRR